MTQKGFEDYLFEVYGHKNGTAKSYITAINIIDELFVNHDFFALKGKSITCLDDLVLLRQIADFVCLQQTLYKKGEDSLFRNINSCQSSNGEKVYWDTKSLSEVLTVVKWVNAFLQLCIG